MRICHYLYCESICGRSADVPNIVKPKVVLDECEKRPTYLSLEAHNPGRMVSCTWTDDAETDVVNLLQDSLLFSRALLTGDCRHHPLAFFSVIPLSPNFYFFLLLGAAYAGIPYKALLGKS